MRGQTGPAACGGPHNLQYPVAQPRPLPGHCVVVQFLVKSTLRILRPVPAAEWAPWQYAATVISGTILPLCQTTALLTPHARDRNNLDRPPPPLTIHDLRDAGPLNLNRHGAGGDPDPKFRNK